MENTNQIPVVSYKPSRWEQISSALEKEAEKESDKRLVDRLKENIQAPFYIVKGAATSVVDTASFAWDAVTSPIETGQKIGEGVVNTYNAITESSAEEKLDWLTHKTVQGIQSTPQERAEALGYVAGSVLIGKGISKGAKTVSKFGKVAEEIAENAKNVASPIQRTTNAVQKIENSAKSIQNKITQSGKKEISKELDPSNRIKYVDVIDDSLKFDMKQVQEKFKHATNFGIRDNFSKKSAAQFAKAISRHIDDKNTLKILGTYHKEPAIHYFNPITKNNVMLKTDGTFWSAWKLSPAQEWNILNRRSL